MNMIRLMSLAVLPACFAGCASHSALSPQHATSLEVPASFSTCASESKIPWLVSVVLEDKYNKKPVTTLVSEFVGGTSADQTRALGYLNDLRLQKYSSGEQMAATHFNACLTQKSVPAFEPKRTLDCYNEQRIIFFLEGWRFDQQVSQEEAAQHLIKANPSADGSSERTIQRLARDVYTILKPGGESAFGQAQFQVCMLANPGVIR